MELIKTLLLFIFGFIFGFGFWYLIFWFVSGESNLFAWHWVTKMIYLMLSFAATSGTLNPFLKD